MAVVPKLNLLHIYHKKQLSGPHIRCVLMLRVPVFGNTCLKKLKHILHQISKKLKCSTTGLWFYKHLMYFTWTKSQKSYGKKNHEIPQLMWRIGFPSFEVNDRDEPKYQVWSPYELTSATISTDERYKDCFLQHSTVPAKSIAVFLQIIHGTEDSILQPPKSLGHCISTHVRMSKSKADFLTQIIPAFNSSCPKAKFFMVQI